MKTPLFRFYISGLKNEVSMVSDLWKLSLLGDRDRAAQSNNSKAPLNSQDVTIGDYFTAAAEFLSRNDFAVLKSGLAALLTHHTQLQDIQPQGIQQLSFFLEKHGAFYHPLRLEAVLQNKRCQSFVLNGAVSEQGLALVQNEYQTIKTLNEKQSPSYLPQVFGCGMVQRGGLDFGFFLGQWFDGYKEFHMAMKNGGKRIVVWRSDGSCYYIGQEQAFPIYENISKILTLYYDLETFHQVHPWHHAAGDFIIRECENGFDTRLITVRGYEDVAGFDATDPDEGGTGQSILILSSLLMFFLNLSLRVRVDRLDGTGEPVMVSEKVLPFVVDGFLAGLDQKDLQLNGTGLKKTFVTFFNHFTLEQIVEIMMTVLEFYPPGPVERQLIGAKMMSHCKSVHEIFKGI